MKTSHEIFCERGPWWLVVPLLLAIPGGLGIGVLAHRVEHGRQIIPHTTIGTNYPRCIVQMDADERIKSATCAQGVKPRIVKVNGENCVVAGMPPTMVACQELLRK